MRQNVEKIKNILKRVLPVYVKDKLVRAHTIVRGAQLFRYDKMRFEKHYLQDINRANFKQLEAKLTFHAHSLEKGLSHDTLRLGFGKAALEKLAEAMRVFSLKGYDKSAKAYVNAISVLRAYIAVHESARYDTGYLEPILGKFINEINECGSTIGGATTVTSESKRDNQTKNFKDLFLNRWSIRDFSEVPVDINKIRGAIELAMKTPSVCNRQSARVHIATEKQLIDRVLKLQGGLTGYATPPALLTVTTDSNSFIALTERNQIYTDGGLFSMSLLLGLEYYQLAACPLNAMLDVSRDKAIRKIINLRPSENIIMFIAVGNFKDDNKVPKSFRFDVDDVVVMDAPRADL